MVTFICFFSICLKFKIEFWTRVKEKLIDFDERFSFFFFFFIYLSMKWLYTTTTTTIIIIIINRINVWLVYVFIYWASFRFGCYAHDSDQSLWILLFKWSGCLWWWWWYICVCVRGFFVSIDFNTYIMMNFKLKNFSLFSPDLV